MFLETNYKNRTTIDDFLYPYLREFTYSRGYEVYEKDNSYFIEMDVPGYSKKDILIEVEDGVLSVKSSADTEARTALNKTIKIPEKAVIDKISATAVDGVLTIKIPLDKKKSKIVVK